VLRLLIFISEVYFHRSIISYISNTGSKIGIESFEVKIILIDNFILFTPDAFVIFAVFQSHFVNLRIPFLFKREHCFTLFASIGPELRGIVKTFSFQAPQLILLIFLSFPNIRAFFEITMEFDFIQNLFFLLSTVVVAVGILWLLIILVHFINHLGTTRD